TTARPRQFEGRSRRCTGKSDMGCHGRANQRHGVHSQALHQVRRPVHSSIYTGQERIRGRGEERHHLLLCGGLLERFQQERGFARGFSYASGTAATTSSAATSSAATTTAALAG